MLGQVRRRGQGYLGYLFWVLLVLLFLWAANLCAMLFDRWVQLLRGLRRTLGLSAPATGPDWWIIAGVGFAATAAVLLALLGYRAYRSAWNRRLHATWGESLPRAHTRILKLPAVAGEPTLRRKAAYLEALLARPSWNWPEPVPPFQDRNGYCAAAAGALRSIEADIAHRAVTVGLVVGLNRNSLIDSLTIVAAAFELQLHVLTRLGKRPTPRTWLELLKRSGASLFLNTYVTREDALYLNLAIRKAAFGVEVVSEGVQNTLADIDLDEVLGHSSIPGLTEFAQLASLGMSVGASGLRLIGSFVEHTANDLLQGVLAAGILYYHGMALAAECLALDEEHRRQPDMTRTMTQATAMACAPAGRLLRDQVRSMRQFLRQRRRQMIGIARDKVGGATSTMRDTIKGMKDRATGLFGKSPDVSPPGSEPME